MAKIECDYCKKEFYKDNYKIKKSKNNFCSNECKQNFRKNKKQIKCNNCGKFFLRVPSAILDKNFCSIKCRCDFFRENNNYEIKGDIVEFTLKNGYKFIIDKSDLNKVNKYYWHKANNYIVTKANGRKIRLHRLITNCPDNMVVDHINHNTLDNRKCNLRCVTNKENQENRSLNKNSTTGFTGVYYNKSNCGYCASIRQNGKLIHLGQFKNIDDAIKARKEAEIKYFGYKQSIRDYDGWVWG